MTTEKRAAARHLPVTEELWQRVDAHLRAFAIRRVSTPESAEAILQDIYVKIRTNLPDLCNPARVDAWVIEIARNAIIDYYRTPERLAALRKELPGMQDEDGDREPKEDLRRMVRGMMGKLSTIYRQALAVTELRGMRQPVAARRLGLLLPGLKSRVQCGHWLLKKMLLDWCDFHFDHWGKIIDYQRHCNCR